MMTPVIRLARPEDADDLFALNAAFNGVEDVTSDGVREALSASGEIVVVAECGGRAVGFCCAQVHHSFCYTTPVAEITEMYVAEGCRRQGCGSGMLRFMEAQLRSRFGVDECHLLTGCANHAARALYASMGYEEHREAYMSKSF